MAKKTNDDDESETSTEMVKRELGPQEIEAKKLALADKVIEMLVVEEKRRANNKKSNDKLGELKSEMRELATEARTGVEMVPAQMTLDEVAGSRLEGALAARRANPRTLQDRSKPVGKAAAEP